MTNQFSKGDIIIGEKRNRNQSYHPIVYFEEIDDLFFLGGMITHSKKFGNVQLKDIHFVQKIDDNPKPSFFVKKFLVKKQEWGPYKLIGKLSNDGVSHIENNKSKTKPEIWEDYLTK